MGASIPRVPAQVIGAIAVFTGLIAFGSAPARAQSSIPQCSVVPTSGATSGTCTIGTSTAYYTCTQASSYPYSTTCTLSGSCTGTVTYNPYAYANATTNNASCGRSVGIQTVTSVARQASQVSLSAVQGQLTTIRDSIQKRLSRSPVAPPLGYVEQDYDQALGYAAKSPRAANPLYTKAPPLTKALPPAPDYGLAVWAVGYGDYEQRRGNVGDLDIGRVTRTGGILGGIDKTFTSVFMASDALVIGVLGGDMASGIHNADLSSSRIRGPSVGSYLVWVNGGFSVDSTFKVDLLGLDQTTAGVVTPLGLTNYVSALNFNQKYDFKTYWIEPTIGISDTRTIWNSVGHGIGLSDGNSIRVQGGARVGTEFQWGRVPLDAALTGLLYNDVSITGGTLASVAGGTLVPSDEGLLFGQVQGKLTFDLSQDIKGLSSYLEGEVRGRSNVLGVGGKVGVRYRW